MAGFEYQLFLGFGV